MQPVGRSLGVSLHNWTEGLELSLDNPSCCLPPGAPRDDAGDYRTPVTLPSKLFFRSLERGERPGLSDDSI